MRSTLLADRYAQALKSAVTDAAQLQKAAESLNTLGMLYAGDAVFRGAMLNPVLDRSVRRQVLDTALEKLEASAEMTLLLPEKKDGAEKNVSYTEVKLAVESEFMPFLFSDSGAGTADIVFAGWGISAPDLGYDDFANVDVKGKFVMLFRGSPGSDDPRLQEWISKNRQYFVKIAQEK